MSAQIGFNGGVYFDVAESFNDIAGRDWSQPFHLTLVDGQYGRLGDRMRLFVNPSGIAFVRDNDPAPPASPAGRRKETG